MSLRLLETLPLEDPFSYPSPNPSHNTNTLNFHPRNHGLYYTTGLLLLITAAVIHYLLTVGKIITPHFLLLKKKKSICLIIWLLRVLIVTRGILDLCCSTQDL